MYSISYRVKSMLLRLVSYNFSLIYHLLISCILEFCILWFLTSPKYCKFLHTSCCFLPFLFKFCFSESEIYFPHSFVQWISTHSSRPNSSKNLFLTNSQNIELKPSLCSPSILLYLLHYRSGIEPYLSFYPQFLIITGTQEIFEY